MNKPRYYGDPPPVPPHLAAAQPPSLIAAAVAEGRTPCPPPPPRSLKPTQRQERDQVQLEVENYCYEDMDLDPEHELVKEGAHSVEFAPGCKENAKQVPVEGYGIDIDGDDSSSTSSSISMSRAPSVERLNISFKYRKTFREHQGARVFKNYKPILKSVYNKTLQWTYNILLFTVGLILVLLWGIINALTAFLQAWFLSPLMRVSLVVVRGVFPLVLEPCSMCMKACVASCVGGSGVFSGGGTGLGFLPKLSAGFNSRE